MRYGLVLTLAVLVVCSQVCMAATDANEVKLLGDEGDGSRGQPVHRIPLVNDEGDPVSPDDEPVMAFSTKMTCGACHTYTKISNGFHFNANDPNVPAGRDGQPQVYVDWATATVVPLSFRDWKGTFKPKQFGISKWEFTKRFGGHLPGGGVGDADSEDVDEIGRQMVSGKLQINCLGCHNRDPRQDQAEYAMQVAKQNFRWAPAAGSGLAVVTGNAGQMPDTYDPLMPETITDPKLMAQIPKIAYRDGTFDADKKVFFDIVREVPSDRCYYCHSNVNVTEYGNEKYEADEDIHLKSGMTCVDCHRGGGSHNLVRGYPGESKFSDNPLADHITCEGCHLGQGQTGAHGGGPVPTAGRMGAPIPKHIGIPKVHFEKLTCTACHSGPWPGDKTDRVKMSQTHMLGTRGVNKNADALPHIEYPVMAKDADGKIGPHKLVWPAYWATEKDGKVEPIAIDVVKSTVGSILGKGKYSQTGSWPEFSDEIMVEALGKLSEALKAKAVYICAGKLFSAGDGGKLVGSENDAARPYLWPMGHNVRPAAQALGIRYCTDCHSTSEGFFFGRVTADGPIAAAKDTSVEMSSFEGIDASYAKLFAKSFVFRPMMKIIAICAAAIIALVVLCYLLKAIGFITAAVVRKG